MTGEKTLESEIRILLDSVDMMEQAVEEWNALPTKERFQSASMMEALARVESAICYKKRFMEWLGKEGPSDKEKPRP